MPHRSCTPAACTLRSASPLHASGWVTWPACITEAFQPRVGRLVCAPQHLCSGVLRVVLMLAPKHGRMPQSMSVLQSSPGLGHPQILLHAKSSTEGCIATGGSAAGQPRAAALSAGRDPAGARARKRARWCTADCTGEGQAHIPLLCCWAHVLCCPGRVLCIAFVQCL